jgi:hypothetical protein
MNEVAKLIRGLQAVVRQLSVDAKVRSERLS